MNKIILLISISGSYLGGAQKRYLALFNYLCDKRKDYYLVVNKKLYLELLQNNVLKSFENVRVIKLYGEIKEKIHNTLNNNRQFDMKIASKGEKSKLRLYIGRKKMFVKSILTWITFIFEFHSVLKQLKSKIVYTIWTGGMFAWPLKGIFHFKLIYGYNDASMEIIDKNIFELFNYTEYWILKYADKIDFLSPAIVEMYKRKIGLIENYRMAVTPNSFIDYELYFSSPKKVNDVIFLSRLWSTKNPILFLKSVKLFNDNYPNIKDINFYLIGEGGREDEIKEYILNNKLSNTAFVGKSLEPWDYLRKSKVFISIQQVNNYPSQSLIEAMACENAIVASDVGETRLLVTEDEGILVDLNPESIAAALYKLFSTDGLIEKLGSNARKKVIENHTVEKYAEYFYSITDI
jgi:glycosyltransferase involved in cell wall biosynthesis